MRSTKIVTNNWATPQWLFDKYNEKYHFTLDAAASPENAKCEFYITEEQDALSKDWATYGMMPDADPHIIWCNPPYTNIKAWVKKAFEASLKGATVVMLLPAGTDTWWFHHLAMKYGKVEFIEGRLKFGEAKGSAMSPSIVVVFTPPAVQTNI